MKASIRWVAPPFCPPREGSSSCGSLEAADPTGKNLPSVSQKKTVCTQLDMLQLISQRRFCSGAFKGAAHMTEMSASLFYRHGIEALPEFGNSRVFWLAPLSVRGFFVPDYRNSALPATTSAAGSADQSGFFRQ